MPLYDIECQICGNQQEVFRKIANMDDLPECCGVAMRRMVAAPYVPQEFQPYKSMITGQMITDRGEHRRHLKEHKCVEVGNEKPTPKKPFAHTKQQKHELRRELSQRLD